MNTTAPMGMLQQPRPFFMIFSVKLWERFGYYGVQGVLAVFLAKQFGFSQKQAFVTFGVFTVLVCGLISIDGYVGDHLLGIKRIAALGAPVLAIGYFVTGVSLLKSGLIFIALEAIAVDNGLFKANLVSLLSKYYPSKDPRSDGAFTLFYMSINIGPLIALSLAPMAADRFGHPVTYNLCGAGLVIALLVCIACHGTVKNIGSKPDFRPMNFSKLLYMLFGSVVMILVRAWLMYNAEVANLVLIVLPIVVAIISLRQVFKLDKTGHDKMFVAFVLTLEAVVFYILYTQIPTSLNFFTINSVHHEIPGFPISPVSLQVFNSLQAVLASPILAGIHTHPGNKGKDLSIPVKLILGVFMYSLGSLMATAVGVWFADTQGLISLWSIVLVYLFQNLGELFISALGLATVAALVPQHLVGLIPGVWFLAQTAAFLLGGYVVTSTTVSGSITDPLETLPVHTNAFGKISLATLDVEVVTLLTVPWLKRVITTSESH